MAINKVINSQSQEFQPVLTDTLVLDAVPTVNSFNSVTSDAVARAVAGASGEVPAVTESDNGKILTAIYDDGGAAVEWADAPSGIPDMAGQDGKILGAVDNGGTMEAQWISKPVSNVTTSDKQFVVGVNGTGKPITVDCANASETTSTGTVVENGSMVGSSFVYVHFDLAGLPVNNLGDATATLVVPEDVSVTENRFTLGTAVVTYWKSSNNSYATATGGSVSGTMVDQAHLTIKAGTYTISGSNPAPSQYTDGLVIMIQGGGIADDWNAFLAAVAEACTSWTLTYTGSEVTGYSITPAVLPTVTGNAGKVLGVNAGATGVEWVAQSTVTVDQSYNSASTNAQSGTAVAGALATVNQVPASTSADEDKVLTVNSSGNAVWAAAQGGGSSYTAGDGISISAQNAISAKVGDGLEIGSHAGSAVTANMSAIAYLGGESNAYLNYVMQLTSDLVNKIETSGISVTLSKVANADWECYNANSNAFPAIVAYRPTVGADYGTRLVLSNTGYSIVDNKLQTGVAYDFNLDDINTSMSNTTWAYIKANPTNYALTFIHSSRFGGYGVVYNLGNNTLSDSTTYTTGSYNYAVVEQGFINVSNPLPASTSSDENKVLTVNSSGAPVWANAQGGGIEAFYITSTTTNNEIYQAYKAGKFLYYQPSTNAEWIPMTMGLYSQSSNWIIYEIQGSYAMTYYASYAAARFNVYSGEIKVAVSTDQADSNAFTTTHKTLTAVNTPIANTSTDVGKVLTITANGPAWVTPS